MSKEHAKATSSSEEFFEVEAVEAQRTTATGLEYLVKWKGYDQSQNTWEPCANLNLAQRVLREFELKQGKGQEQDSGEEEVMDVPVKRRRLRTATGLQRKVSPKSDLDAHYLPDNYATYTDEEEELVVKPVKVGKKSQGRTEDLEILSVRVGRDSEYIWTAVTKEGGKVDLSLEQVKKRAPLALIDYLVSKLRFA